MARVNLNDPDLFGSLAAEDEDEAVFESYQVERQELSRLLSKRLGDNLVVVSAFRGEGKSALLRMAAQRLKAEGKVFNAKVTATAITVEKTSPDVALLTRYWKAAIYEYVAKEVGSKIGFAYDDASMSLVEFAQNKGLKDRPLIIALFDRVKWKIPGIPELGRSREVATAAAEEIVRRWVEDGQDFWLFIDDIDANFKDTKESRAKLMGFFQAVREIRNETQGLRIRATVRPNIWAILRGEYPDSGKIDTDYMVDLRWEEDQLRDLLAARIKAQMKRGGVEPPVDNPRKVIQIAFEDPMQWGKEVRPPHVVLSTFSRLRPRWLIEICKPAAAHAFKNGNQRIQLGDITAVVSGVGKRRQGDLATEYEPQCKHIPQILEIFKGQKEEYATDELLSMIQSKLLTHFKPEILGASSVTPVVVARLLFEIGFLTGRRSGADGFVHIGFSESVKLLSPDSPIPVDLTWEIHPIFRQSLGMRDEHGRIARPR